ncbi:hypothetical protein O4J56_29740 [Nocardiopsis sp. RSe5-2]|uniref:Uncharacterized protein n=1 Tax=Nocardiopsis endophytica TaxID=3018445 RepID=A0ABT4UER8_9ACTN|nr:hypothetical protein [Nocardiopsis endophytica]MDA2814865.1 hypothetical protein [Nocardiopsis endophytica]
MPARLFASLSALATTVFVAPIRALRPSRPSQEARLKAAIARSEAAAAARAQRPSPDAFVHRPRHARPYTTPVSIPDYARFCQADVRHRALWRLTYEPDARAPYQAHHRTRKNITLAASDVDALDFALTEFTPPGYARSYLRDREHPARPARPAPDGGTR